MENYWLDFVKKPTIIETFVNILLCAFPIWVATRRHAWSSWGSDPSTVSYGPFKRIEIKSPFFHIN